jgi:hypothetical protein
MPPQEEATIRAFITPNRRPRWIQALNSPKRRRLFLDGLNHCPDLDPRFARLLPPNADVVRLLRDHGAPSICYLISDVAELDGRELPLVEAVQEVAAAGWGTIIGCVPGRLAYYRDEEGSRHFLLVRAEGR